MLTNLPDGDSAAEPPVPIPNTEVKCRHVDGSAVLSRVRVDNCQAPIRSSSSAWLERLPVTQEVTGSIPVCSAISKAPAHMPRGFSFLNAQQTNLKQAEQPSQLVLHPAPGVHNSLQQGRAVIVRAASPVLENANWIFSLLCRPFVLSGISEPPFPYGTETCVQEIFLS